MVTKRNETQHLEGTIEKARACFADDKMHRYVVCDVTGVYRVATLEDVDMDGKYADYPTAFSTFQ